MRYAALFFLFLFFSRESEAFHGEEWDAKLQKLAAAYTPDLPNSYYCWKIPESEFLKFLDIYPSRPIAYNSSGMRSHGNFFLWFLLRQIKPALVIESGVFRGQSTWTIEQAAPNAKLICIDPDPTSRVYTSKTASYTTSDFSHLEIELAEGPVVCFFDDHINAFERVIQSHQKGIKYLIFDDNYSACNEREIYHLTLSNCFEMEQFKDKREILKKMIKHYFVMPQIIGSSSNHPACPKVTTRIPAIWQSLADVDSVYRNKMRVFADDSVEYRWITYVELF